MPDAGEILGGRYRLMHPLGEGGMATIWAAEHLTMGNLVAVKIISAELVDCELAITRFSREARAAAKLRSPYVVQLFDHDVDPVHGPYIAMELLEGENFAERLERERTISTDELCRILQQVSKGLTRAHAADIVHRDMKPDNIFLALDDDAVETAKILDFGVAKADSPFLVRSTKTVAGALVGTLSYMSPEQAQGREVDHRTDLWALGVIAFEALVGSRPFEDEAPGAIVMQICAHPIPVPSSVNPDVPPGFDAWFAKACNRAPAERFASAEELVGALVEVCDADELSLGDMLVEVCVEEAEASVPEPEQPAKSGRPTKAKRPVLQLVDSEPPPSMEDDPSDEEDLPGVDVEFEFEPEYFVSDGALTVGPIGLETVRVGYHEGYASIDAFLWTDGWPRWRRALEVFEKHPAHGKERPVRDLELIGPRCDVPATAPALPSAVPVDLVSAKEPTSKRPNPPAAVKPPKPAVKPPKPSVRPPKPTSTKPPKRNSVKPPKRNSIKPPKPPKPSSPKPPKPGSLKPPKPTSAKSAVKPAVAGHEPNPSKSKRAAPVSAVRSVSKTPTRETCYYLTDSVMTVGPVRASMLCRGVDADKIPQDALAWREGWSEWRPVSKILAEVKKSPMAPLGMLRSRPGLECVGLKTRVPSEAPAVSPDTSGRSSG